MIFIISNFRCNLFVYVISYLSIKIKSSSDETNLFNVFFFLRKRVIKNIFIGSIIFSFIYYFKKEKTINIRGKQFHSNYW